jgi:deoxyribonuclease-4
MGIFGVAGVPTNYKGKFKDLFNWLREMNLNAYEIQCVYGFKISDINKQIIMQEKEKGFNFSIHAPYYINMGSLNSPVVERSKDNMKQGIELAKSCYEELNSIKGKVNIIKQDLDKYKEEVFE